MAIAARHQANRRLSAIASNAATAVTVKAHNPSPTAVRSNTCSDPSTIIATIGREVLAMIVLAEFTPRAADAPVKQSGPGRALE
jgi:hypothetical protein